MVNSEVIMKMGLDDITERIKQNLHETHDQLKEHKEVNPKTLQQLVKDIGKLKETHENVNRQNINSNLEDAIESLTAIERMIQKMKEAESDALTRNIQKVVAQELEEIARDEVANFTVPLDFFHEKKIDLKKFLRSKQKVEKVYKSKPQ